MPPFDPVRDAVLNSPVIQSPLTSTAPGYPFPISTSFPHLRPPSPTPSPSVSRRATNISALLNAADDDEPRPRSSRRSSLTHLLHPSDDDGDNKLGFAQPLRRQPNSLPDSDDEHRPTTSSSRFTAPSPSRSVSPNFAFPSVSPVMAPPPPPPPKTLPYNPKKRLTPATTVLKPLSQAEIAMYKTWVGTGTMKLQKRKREASPDTEGAPPAKKRLTRDAVAVVEHYNSRPDVGVLQRQDSPIIGLKNFNNWIKSVLIQRYAYPALIGESIVEGARTRRDRRLFGRVLDIGCGKGGDINKWTKAKIADYIGVDIAAVSVNQARQRWESMRVNRFNARFAPLDCYELPLSHALDERYLRAPPIDVVSMQFCMHYAFDSEKRARRMLENVSEYLRPGGAFIGTIPNAEILLDRLDELPDDAQDLEFGNDVYKIKFDERQHEGLYGHKYSFFLQDAVDDVPEYIVHWMPFVKLAEEYGLRLVYKREFHSVYQDFQEEKEFADLLVRMKVINAEGESAMDEDQWEAANIYIAFAFEKIS